MTQQLTRASDRTRYANLLTDPAFLSISLLAFVGTLGTSVLSPALPGIADGLDVPDARVGLLLTSFKGSAMLTIVATSVLADLHGRRPVVLPSLVAFGGAGTGMYLVDSFAGLLLLSALLGAGFGGFMPLSIALIGDVYAGTVGSTAQGLRAGFAGIGSVVFPVVTGVLAAIAWNYPFLLYLGVLPVVVVAYLYVPEKSPVRPRERSFAGTLRRYGAAIRSEVASLDMSLLIGGGFLRDFVRLGVYTFVPLFAVRTLDASLVAAGAVLSIRGVAAILVSPLLGAIVSTASRKRVLVGSFGLAAVGVALVPFSGGVTTLALAFAVYSVGDAISSPIVKDTVTDTASSEHRAGIVGALNVLKNGGQAVAPAFFGMVLAVSGYDAVFLLAATFAAVYVTLVVAFLDPRI